MGAQAKSKLWVETEGGSVDKAEAGVSRGAAQGPLWGETGTGMGAKSPRDMLLVTQVTEGSAVGGVGVGASPGSASEASGE